MPRLKRMKIYEPISIEYEREETRDERNDDESNDDERESTGEFESESESRFLPPEKGWWSSPKIILSLDDKRIKTALLYHKEQIKILEAELAARQITGNSRISEYRLVHSGCREEFTQIDKRGIGRLSDVDRKIKRTLQRQRFLSSEQKSLIFQIYLDAKKQLDQT